MKNKKLSMRNTLLTLASIAIVIAAVISGCSSNTGAIEGSGGESGEASHSETGGEGGGEAGEASHSLSGGEGSGGSGEAGESGTYYALDATFDEVQSGARLIMNHDAQTNSFTGTVENTTNNVLSQVRVEVHLNNGVELGPTTPKDLAPGQVIDVTLQATDTNFTTWTAHPEVSVDAEGGHSEIGGEGGGEAGEGRGEHSGGEGGEHDSGGESGN